MKQDKFFQELSSKKEFIWINPYKLPHAATDALCSLVVSDYDIEQAQQRLLRFAPFIKKAFPETAEAQGIIESPLVQIPKMQEELQKETQTKILGKLFLKMDSHLAIAGSVKARGGIYEVLKHAEDLAIQNGKITTKDCYSRFLDEDMKEFMSQFTMQVGSTGNLGMSIGIMSAALGFKVKIHMSADAKQWKKDLLRSRGVEVFEYNDDYSRAVEEGRKNSEKDPFSYFVDDEKSIDLFIGYATAAKRLQNQFKEQGICVDKDHPLFVYIPAGVGGAPGGISYGLKRIWGDNVHCFFVEPTECPSVLLGIATQKHEKANVRDYGISGKTEADGLACASPSGFVTRFMTNIVSGDSTVSDGRLYDFLRMLHNSEEIDIEPSSCAAFMGPCMLFKSEEGKRYCKNAGLSKEVLSNATHIAWATGGRMIPSQIKEKYLDTYI